MFLYKLFSEHSFMYRLSILFIELLRIPFFHQSNNSDSIELIETMPIFTWSFTLDRVHILLYFFY